MPAAPPRSESPAPAGEAFRDDLRSSADSQPRRALLAPARVRELSAIDGVKATAALAGTLLALAGAIAAAIAWWQPPVILAAILVIGSRQHALFVLAHDAAHYRMYRRRWLNDLVGRACGMIGGISMCTYRVIHRLHHNHLYGPLDPDIALHGGYPRGKAYLAGKLAKDLAGLTAWKTYAYFFGAPALNAATGRAPRPLDDTAPRLRAAARRDRWLVAGFHLAAPIAAFAAGWGVEYLVLWLLPLATLVPAILRLRAICEHGAVADLSSPLRAARTNLAPGWVRWLLFPHHVGYHLEHHVYPAIPHYNLPACHREMAARGRLDGAEVRPFGETLKRVFAAPRAA